MTPVFLSHVYVVIDPASYEAIRHSAEIRALASAKEKTVDPSHGGWTAFYITGRQTAIEILVAGSTSAGDQWRLGQSGIGLGYGDAGGTPYIEKRLRATFGEKVMLEAGKSETPGVVPWLIEIDVEGDGSDVLSTWFTEIAPGYLVARYPGAGIEHLLSHQQYLAAGFLPDRLLDDVVGLTVALNPSEASILVAELKVAGWMIRQMEEKTVISGPDIAITIIPAGSRAGIREVGLRLRRPTRRQDTSLGSAELLLDGEMGRLRFWGSN
jgi:hypothetical protein